MLWSIRSSRRQLSWQEGMPGATEVAFRRRSSEAISLGSRWAYPEEIRSAGASLGNCGAGRRRMQPARTAEGRLATDRRRRRMAGGGGRGGTSNGSNSGAETLVA